MATISLEQGGGLLSLKVPHKVLVDGVFVGVMRTPQVQIRLPRGSHGITIQSLIPGFSATQNVVADDSRPLTLTFRSRGGWWDFFFTLDLAWWVAGLFLRLASPWSWISRLLSDGFFAAWLLYEWIIRKRYFNFSIQQNNLSQ